MSEMAPEEIVPDDIGNLLVAANVDDPAEMAEGQVPEVSIEMSLDEEIVLVLAFPNTGEAVDRQAIATLFLIAAQSWPAILDQMEAPDA